ncbi:MAG TPA: alkaline phosphatase [Bryobacteraceae bacterium]
MPPRFLLFFLTGVSLFAQQRAKNVILFLGDAGGLSTLNAASIHGYKEPRSLYIQRMPHIGLSETSSTSSWVTDSAAGMTAIVTGRKVANGVLSLAPGADASAPGTPLKTILEYAEEKGLSTGVVSNMNMADATPAACYSHVNSRRKFGEIFEQIWRPSYGDGVDLVLGNGRKTILASTGEMKIDVEKSLADSGRNFVAGLSLIPETARRVVSLEDDANFDVEAATAKAIEILSKNPKGYFLMVEWDLHPSRPERCLDTVVKFDKLIHKTTETAGKNTLVMFTADHSFDLRVIRGKKGQDVRLPSARNVGKDAPAAAETDVDVMVGSAHSGEEVVVAAQGPGSEKVNGFMSNTDLFKVMMSAYGWQADRPR